MSAFNNLSRVKLVNPEDAEAQIHQSKPLGFPRTGLGPLTRFFGKPWTFRPGLRTPAARAGPPRLLGHGWHWPPGAMATYGPRTEQAARPFTTCD
jgi:hypothetical protein